jgi:hypothetical protein
LTPGSGIWDGKKSGSGMRDEHPRSFFQELRNRFLRLKILLKFFYAYPGSGNFFTLDSGW